jgi:hypothetical protein
MIGNAGSHPTRRTKRLPPGPILAAIPLFYPYCLSRAAGCMVLVGLEAA